jgi:hypothetical protein
MPAAEGEQAIANFAAHTDDVLFSSTPHDFTEATHDNVQPVEHWAERFALYGLFHDLDTPWAIRFRRDWATQPHRLVRAYERVLARTREENRQLRDALQRARRQPN